MTLYSLDTNALLRYLLLDNKVQAYTVRDVILAARDRQAELYISELAFMEAVFVLTKVYRQPIVDVSKQLSDLASLPYIYVEKRSVVLRALKELSDRRYSFIDLLILFDAKSQDRKLLTFDKALLKLEQIV